MKVDALHEEMQLKIDFSQQKIRKNMRCNNDDQAVSFPLCNSGHLSRVARTGRRGMATWRLRVCVC